jgi:hypothetical protein
MTRLALALLSCALVACGPSKPRPDGGTIDTSCGIDCAAQAKFGLIIGTCFEYSNTNAGQNPASLGAEVLELFTLEGDVKVIPVEYRELGQLRMRDSFGIVDGELKLMRREFAGGNSVTWKDASNAIVGVGWLRTTSATGETLEGDRTATTVTAGGAGMNAPATHKVTLNTAVTSDLNTPLKAYPDGLSMLFNAAPGTDNRRTWVPDVGFIGFSNTFTLGGSGTATPYKLQKIRNLKDTDGGTVVPCGFGAP